jgi:hypothetical protein
MRRLSECAIGLGLAVVLLAGEGGAQEKFTMGMGRGT